MTEIISVRFKEGGKSYYFNPNGLTVVPGDRVIIETSRGVEFGECVEGNRLIDEMELVSPLRPVVRKATDADFKALEQNKEKEKKAFQICQQKIQEHGLDMKLVEVEYNFDGSKILFFFTSEGRVDFRALVRDLASVFHTRIELRQRLSDRLPSRVHQDGQDPEPVPEPHQDLRGLRAAHVLPEVRAGGL